MFRLQFEHAKRNFMAPFTAFCLSLSVLFATVSPASAVAYTESWYINVTNTLITSYDFGQVSVGTSESVILKLVLSPDTAVTQIDDLPTTTDPFSALAPGPTPVQCLIGDLCRIVEVFFSPQSEGLYSANLNWNFTLDFDPTATLPLNGEGVGVVPLPGALPLFATGLGALGLLGWRRKRKQAAA